MLIIFCHFYYFQKCRYSDSKQKPNIVSVHVTLGNKKIILHCEKGCNTYEAYMIQLYMRDIVLDLVYNTLELCFYSSSSNCLCVLENKCK